MKLLRIIKAPADCLRKGETGHLVPITGGFSIRRERPSGVTISRVECLEDAGVAGDRVIDWQVLLDGRGHHFIKPVATA